MAKARKDGKPQRNRRNLAKRLKILARNTQLIQQYNEEINDQNNH
jgi:hypothetical protein